MSKIIIEKGTSKEDGSCNGCNNHLWPICHNVYVIYLKYISFRLCEDCMQKMLTMIKDIQKPKE